MKKTLLVLTLTILIGSLFIVSADALGFKNKTPGGVKNDSIAAEVLGITEDELKTQLKENDYSLYAILEKAGKVDAYKTAVLKSQKESLDELVAAGKITQKQADDVYAKCEEMIGNFNADVSGFKSNVRDSYGEAADSFKENFKSRIKTDCVAAEVLGITAEELGNQLKENDYNLYAVLEKAGKVNEYKTALLNKQKENFSKAVSDGKITQEQADDMYAKCEEMINSFTAENGMFKFGAGEGKNKGMDRGMWNRAEKNGDTENNTTGVTPDFSGKRRGNGALKSM